MALGLVWWRLVVIYGGVLELEYLQGQRIEEVFPARAKALNACTSPGAP
jgi:hypothetical protein